MFWDDLYLLIQTFYLTIPFIMNTFSVKRNFKKLIFVLENTLATTFHKELYLYLLVAIYVLTIQCYFNTTHEWILSCDFWRYNFKRLKVSSWTLSCKTFWESTISCQVGKQFLIYNYKQIQTLLDMKCSYCMLIIRMLQDVSWT